MSVEFEPGSWADWRGYVADIAYGAVQAAVCPPLGAAMSAIASFAHIWPLSYCDDGDEAEPDTLLISRENLDAVLQRIAPHRVSFGASISEDVRARVLASWKECAHQIYSRQLDLATTCCPGVQLALSVKPPEVGSPVVLIQAFGGRFSAENPVILSTPSTLFLVQDEDPSGERTQRFFERIRGTVASNQSRVEFMFSHEFQHIQHGDALVRSVIDIALRVISAGCYIALLSSSPLPWIGALFQASASVFCIEAIRRVIHIHLSQWMETRADREAVQRLGTSIGARRFLETLTHVDYLHPHPRIRLAAVEALGLS